MKKLILTIGLLGVLYSGNLSSQTISSGRTGNYQAAHTKTTELKHTKLKVSFDYQKEQMNGEEWLTASPYFYASDTLVLNAKGMLIHEVALSSAGKNTPLKFDYKSDLLKINLDKVYSKNQEYTVYIKYTARPNEVKQDGSAAISDAKGLYFINAQRKDAEKPVQIWTQGETESSSAWFPTIDKPNQKTTQEIYMTVPDLYVTLSNGFLKSSNKESNGLRTDHWVMDKKHAPYLFFMGVGDFAVVKDLYKNIPVDYYVEKEYETSAKQIFGNTPEMMAFFSKVLNYEYPFSKYSQMVGRDYVSGAMENTTAVLHQEAAQQKPGDLIDENKWENTIAHELFHHWFGDLVTAESWSNITVNESLANYSEYLWTDFKYGKDAADHHLQKDLSAYKTDPIHYSKDLVRFNYQSREDVFDVVSYNKGGGILHMLRNYLGDDAFFAGLNSYLKANEYGTGEAHQLRLAWEKISGKDLNWFFNQWYFGNGHPKLNITYSYEPVKKEVTVSVNQSQSEFFEFPLDIDVYDNGKRTRSSVWVSAKPNNNFTLPAAAKPDLVNVNPQGILLAEIKDTKTADQYAFQYANAKEFTSRNEAVQFAKTAPSAAASLKILSAALKDNFFRIRIEAITALDLQKPEISKAVLADVEKIATNDPKTLVRAAAMIALAKTKNKKYLPLFQNGLKAVSNAVRAASLYGISFLEPENISENAADIDLSNASESILLALLPTIVQNKLEKQMPAIAQMVAFYPFLKFQDPALGNAAEDGFHWIMKTDNLKATENITKVLSQAKGQIGDNPQAKMMIISMLKEGLAEKMQVLKANPQSPTIHQQVDAINAALKSFAN